jgi:hypothetical protein
MWLRRIVPRVDSRLFRVQRIKGGAGRLFSLIRVFEFRAAFLDQHSGALS